MNLITAETILDKASVPYEYKEELHELVIFTTGKGFPAAKISTMYQLKGVVDYEDISQWYVHEKAQLIATVINDFLVTPENERENGTLNSATMNWYTERFAGPLSERWTSPSIELPGEVEKVHNGWFKRMIKEYHDLYIRNAKLGQRIDKNYCTEELDDKCYLSAMTDQFEATKNVLEALEKRISLTCKGKVKIKKYVNLSENFK